MEDFLLKSTLCQILLFAIYQLAFEREKMHKFNRFFLLFCLVFSLVIPFISIEIYEEIIVSEVPNVVSSEQFKESSNLINSEKSKNYLPAIFWIIYVLISSILFFRFLKNINQIKKRIVSNPKKKIGEATLILVQKNILPHTFLNYIFINQNDYTNRNIEQELYTHELTHAKQKHTLDILFLEILKILFWFNPMLILYKKAIQLNHEFLADEKVIAHYNNISFYQNLLLEKASWKNNYHFVSNLNFLVTKKRLIMMTKKTSKNIIIFKKLALLPLLSGLIYVTCINTVAQEKKQTTEKKQTLSENDKREASYYAGVRFILYNSGIQKKNKWDIEGGEKIIDKTYEDLTPEEKKEFSMFLFIPQGFIKKSPTNKELDDFKNSKKYAIWIDGVNVENEQLNKFKASEIAYFSGSVVLKNARTKKHPQPFQYWFYTHTYFDKNEMAKAPEKYSGEKIVQFKNVKYK